MTLNLTRDQLPGTKSIDDSKDLSPDIKRLMKDMQKIWAPQRRTSRDSESLSSLRPAVGWAKTRRDAPGRAVLEPTRYPIKRRNVKVTTRELDHSYEVAGIRLAIDSRFPAAGCSALLPPATMKRLHTRQTLPTVCGDLDLFYLASSQ